MSKLRYIKAVIRMHDAGHISEAAALADIGVYIDILRGVPQYPVSSAGVHIRTPIYTSDITTGTPLPPVKGTGDVR